jgi:hypothetical protein
MSNGMTTGGALGSALMRGGGDIGGQPRAPNRDFAYKPGLGPMVYEDGGKISNVTDEEFQRTFRDMPGEERGGALRAALANQRTAAEADPRIAANIEKNEAAIARQNGGAPIVTDPAERQAMFQREMARKELRRGGVPNAMAGILANARDDPKTQGLLAAAMSGNPMAARALGEMAGPLDDAFKQAQIGEMNARVGWLNNPVNNPAYQQEIRFLENRTDLDPDEKNDAMAEINRRYGINAGSPPPTTGAGGPVPTPRTAVPTESGTMLKPTQIANLEAIGANYDANPAAVGQQLVDELRKIPHLSDEDRLNELRRITGNPTATLENPAGFNVQYDPTLIGSMSLGG